MIKVYKRKWYGLKLICEFNSHSHDIVVSSAGVLTIRRTHDERVSVLALNDSEWSVAKECD